jgi:hypothetical protein
MRKARLRDEPFYTENDSLYWYFLIWLCSISEWIHTEQMNGALLSIVSNFKRIRA